MYKPELLLPAGNIEAFFAAISGGADAVYMGFKKFNARNRAANFSCSDLIQVVSEARSKNIKIYVTLNTLIKNEEVSDLIELLDVLSQIDIDAIIIQDFAILNLLSKFFKNIKIHTSTQMAIHNSLGCNYFDNLGIERIILSRELTPNELKLISVHSKIPKEVFVHGALCYSLSGHCLFSSYLGGNSANRGSCTQVCRRNFISENSKNTFFSLKDLQLIDFIPFFDELKISSLKIEGRMKNPEYIYNTARAYRMAIDNHSKIPEAKEILKNDFAREKTAWFMDKSIKNSITSNPGTGVYVGKILSVNNQFINIHSDIELNNNSKLRLRNYKDVETEFIKINKIVSDKNNYTIYCNTENITISDEVYLVGTRQFNFKTKFSNFKSKELKTIENKQKEFIKNSFKVSNSKPDNRTKIFLRISDLNYIKKINIQEFEAIYLKLRFAELKSVSLSNIDNEIKHKLCIELPKYISEIKIEDYKKLIHELINFGFKNFVISHISQIDLLPLGCKISCNENVYLLNDIAINFIKSKGIRNYCYPLENDYPNMIAGKDRDGIIPVYFYPELFYSRMPVEPTFFSDETSRKYRKISFNGFTIIADTKPVSLTHNINKFKNKGFHKFIIDMSLEMNSQKLPYILSAIRKSEKINGSNDFNIKKGLH
jgi:putative protease